MKLIINIEMLVGSIIIICDKEFIVIGNEFERDFYLTRIINLHSLEELKVSEKEVISKISITNDPKKEIYNLVSSNFICDSVLDGMEVKTYDLDYISLNSRTGKPISSMKIESQFAKIPMINEYIPDNVVKELPFISKPSILCGNSEFNILSNEITNGKENKVLIHRISRIEEIDSSHRYFELFNSSLKEIGLVP